MSRYWRKKVGRVLGTLQCPSGKKTIVKMGTRFCFLVVFWGRGFFVGCFLEQQASAGGTGAVLLAAYLQMEWFHCSFSLKK